MVASSLPLPEGGALIRRGQVRLANPQLHLVMEHRVALRHVALALASIARS